MAGVQVFEQEQHEHEHEHERCAHKKTLCFRQRVFIINPARPTFALVGTIIGSGSLTAVFGMGTGVTFQIKSPERVVLAVKLIQPGILRLDGCKVMRSDSISGLTERVRVQDNGGQAFVR